MNTVPPMSALLRQIIALSGSLAVVCSFSCERHRPEELAGHGEHVRSEASKHEQPSAKEKEAHATSHGDDQHRATTAMSVTPPPASATPANFFPSPTPH